MRISQTTKQEIRQRILKVALEAFCTLGYEKVKISSISRECQIAEGTLYNYFKDKPTLFIHAFIHGGSIGHREYIQKEPKHLDALVSELIEILDVYWRIKDPNLETVYKSFFHVSRGQALKEDFDMSAAIESANKPVVVAAKKLFESLSLTSCSLQDLLEVLEVQINGLYDDYIYGKSTFDQFLAVSKRHLRVILVNHVDF